MASWNLGPKLAWGAPAAAIVAIALVAPGIAWLPTLPFLAAGAEPAAYGVTVAVLAGLCLLGAAAAARPRTAWLYAAIVVACAWVFRDRYGVLGDSRLVVGSVQAYGTGVHVYRAPLAMKALGAVGELGRGWLQVGTSLALVSVACGLVTAGLVRLAGASRIPLGAALAATFLAPLGFVYWGHVETYPLFSAALAGVLALLSRDYAVGRLRPPAVGAMALLCLVHYAGALVPLAVLLAPPPGVAARVPRFLRFALGAAGAAAALVLTWPHTLLGFPAADAPRVPYLAEALEGACLTLLPLGLAIPGAARRDPFLRFTLLVFAGFAALPFLFRFDRGVYGDLDLLAPAAVPLSVLALQGTRGRGRRLLVLLLAGIPWTAAVLTAGRTGFGLDHVQRYTARASLGPDARANGYEIVAFARAERGEFADGIACLEEALRVTPGNHRLWGGLGDLQLAAGDTAAAVESLLRSLDSPRRPRTVEVLVPVLAQYGEVEAAAAVAESYPDDVARSGPASAAACVAGITLGRLQEAEAWARARLAVDPGDDLAWFNLAAALVRQGRTDDARAAVEQAVRIAPDDPRYREALNRFAGN